MNPGKLFASIFLFCIVASPAIAQTPDFSEGQVTIPYAELKDLLQALEKSQLEKPKPKPPVAAALTSARYRLDLSGSTPRLTAEIQARGFQEGWHTLPLFGGSPQLESNESGDSVHVVREDEAYALLFEGAGTFSATLASALPPVSEWAKKERIEFAPAPATLCELRVTGVPQGSRFGIEGQAPSRTEANGELVFHLPADDKKWQFRLEESSGEEEALLPSSWTLHSEIFSEFIDGRLIHHARVQARAETGSGSSMTLEVPADASVTEVEGDDLVQWTRLPRREDSRSIEIRWENRDVLNRTLLIDWETSQSALADSWTLAIPRAVNPDLELKTLVSRTLVALSPPEGLELTHPSFRRLAPRTDGGSGWVDRRDHRR